jgi:hypothetical protein
MRILITLILAVTALSHYDEDMQDDMVYICDNGDCRWITIYR